MFVMRTYRDKEAGEQDIRQLMSKLIPNGEWENLGLISHGSMTHITSSEGREISEGFHSFEKVLYHFGHESYLMASLGSGKYLLRPVVKDGKLIMIKKMSDQGFHSYEHSLCHFDRDENYLVGVLGAGKYLLKPIFENGQIVELKTLTDRGFHDYKPFSYHFCGIRYNYLMGITGDTRYLLEPVKEKGEIVEFRTIAEFFGFPRMYTYLSKNYYAKYFRSTFHYDKFVYSKQGKIARFSGNHQFKGHEPEYLGEAVEFYVTLPKIKLLDLIFKRR
jgi:hypothetical protein